MKSNNPEAGELSMDDEGPEVRQRAEARDDQADVLTDRDKADESVADVSPAEEGGDVSSESAVLDELQAMKEKYLRLAAEYDNFRKRTDRERLESRDRAQGQLVEKLLEPLDDLQRVALSDAGPVSLEALLEGVRMVERKLTRVLEAAGLEPLDARGQPFDPEIHEALMMTPTDAAEEDDTVGEVFQPGYRFRGLLLRPARVQVRKMG